ncbi:hypothetical protein A5714_05745 [Mycobacterium sp. E2462]|uniref:DUF732 domain-containing protein n=1 Tax=unclassified Mycobacterium TaxID=2642494 RepID=UPI000801AD99|nr:MULTISPECIES: DUF732 domain-containing protein [unclassified Mycobacterium]OBG72826.1 hypothetical protein A5700_08260 [Mycobacterium sp. E1214]OBH22701.1 hypothetical protein A5693_01330 [Mycobacterium sp. E1319]OBI22935.1 hypothetical protein A5714_05745 [Mycobacterium sp. E2462]
MKLLLIVASAFAAIGMAVPAYADDDMDSKFQASLDAAGITYDPSTVVAAGKWVCTTYQGGSGTSDVVSGLQAKNDGLSDDKAAKFAAIAASTYCPYVMTSGPGAKTAGSSS